MGKKNRSDAADMPRTLLPGGQVSLSPLTRKRDHSDLRYPRGRVLNGCIFGNRSYFYLYDRDFGITRVSSPVWWPPGTGIRRFFQTLSGILGMKAFKADSMTIFSMLRMNENHKRSVAQTILSESGAIVKCQSCGNYHDRLDGRANHLAFSTGEQLILRGDARVRDFKSNFDALKSLMGRILTESSRTGRCHQMKRGSGPPEGALKLPGQHEPAPAGPLRQSAGDRVKQL